MTRDLDWGVPVPGEDGKVLYVWLDAPIGYITNTKVWAEKNKARIGKTIGKMTTHELVHFIGKDNIVFHCIIFPNNFEGTRRILYLPKNVPANEFMNLEGDKISTSQEIGQFGCMNTWKTSQIDKMRCVMFSLQLCQSRRIVNSRGPISKIA